MMSGIPEVFSRVANAAIPPVVVVLGATGTGKSKLAISLAQKFRGEIISADSMQVYKDLDILTNKVTAEETKGIPHHMISTVEPCQHFDVTHFRNQALPIVERILSEGKIPFIVGGTNYYIESLLWEVLVDKSGDTHNSVSDAFPGPETKKRKIDNSVSTSEDYNVLKLFETTRGQVEEDELSPFTSTQLYSALQEVDQDRSTKLHPNDRRKIIRSLQVYYQTGRKHSQILSEQSVKNNDGQTDGVGSSNCHLGGPLRFPSCLCLWIESEKPILIERINARVDDMVERGLRRELEAYIGKLKEANSNLDFTRGLLQSIGFKEFNAYLQLDPDEWYTDVGNKLFEDGIELLKIATRQYATKQVRWINQRFLRPGRRQVPPVYSLDGTLADPVNWEKNITVPALEILNSKLSGRLDDPLLAARLVPHKEDDDDLIARVCEVCENKVFLGEFQWKAHINGRKHQKMAKRLKLLKDLKTNYAVKSADVNKEDEINIT